LDLSGGPVVTGHTYSSDFPTTPGAFDQTHNGESDVFVAKFEIRTEVELTENVIGLPETFELIQNYPNPFNSITQIKYQIPEDSHVTLKIHNVMGQEVKTLVESDEQAGNYEVTWDGRDAGGIEVSAGIYFCTLKAGEFSKTRKMVLLR